jgi:hypothetical protein
MSRKMSVACGVEVGKGGVSHVNRQGGGKYVLDDMLKMMVGCVREGILYIPPCCITDRVVYGKHSNLRASQDATRVLGWYNLIVRKCVCQCLKC